MRNYDTIQILNPLSLEIVDRQVIPSFHFTIKSKSKGP